MSEVASRRRGRLSLDPRQTWVNASPVRRARCPDRHRGMREVGIIKSPRAHEDQMWPRLGLAEERCPAGLTEPPVHSGAAVRNAEVIFCPSGDSECRGAEAGIDGSTAGAEILAFSAPAHARDDRRLRTLPADRPAKTSACDRHGQHPSNEATIHVRTDNEQLQSTLR